MSFKPKLSFILFYFLSTLLVLTQGCSTLSSDIKTLKSSSIVKPRTSNHENYRYLIGAGDTLNIFVWKNEDVSTTVIVRPDGMINAPLVEELKVSDKTPSEVAKKLESALSKFIRDPIVTVTLSTFVGPYHEQVRVIGEASNPQTLAYSEDMTMLDVLIAVGGLTEYADGNGAVLARVIDGKYQQFTVKMDDLLQDGDLNANVDILPGDIIIIPESWF